MRCECRQAVREKLEELLAWVEALERAKMVVATDSGAAAMAVAYDRVRVHLRAEIAALRSPLAKPRV